MSIEFSFSARCRKLERLTERAKELAGQEGYGLTKGENWMNFHLCPMGDLPVAWEKENGPFGGWKISGTCYTTPSGAGFHKAALEFLERLCQGTCKGLTVEDVTGYEEHRDFQRMKEEHFYPWLRMLVKLCKENAETGEYTGLRLCWNLDQYQPEEIPGTVVTPMGRFDTRALVNTVQSLSVRWLAERFFVWDRPERDALFFRNMGLQLLWEDCAFLPSKGREADRRCNGQILDALELAWKLDPELPLPMDAYREVCALDGREPVIPDSAPEMEETYPIGFRKGLVTQSYSCLRLRLPGSYEYRWEEDEKGSGNALWWDGREDSPAWRITVLKRREGEAELRDMTGQGQDLEERSLKDGAARWCWSPLKGDEGYFQAYCEAVCGPYLYLLTVTYRGEERREEVYALLRSLDVVKEQEPETRTESYSDGSAGN